MWANVSSCLTWSMCRCGTILWKDSYAEWILSTPNPQRTAIHPSSSPSHPLLFALPFPDPALALCMWVYFYVYCIALPSLTFIPCLAWIVCPILVFSTSSLLSTLEMFWLLFFCISLCLTISCLFCFVQLMRSLSRMPPSWLIYLPTCGLLIYLSLSVFPLFLWKPYIKINLSCFRSLSDLSYAPSAAHTSPCIFCVLTAVSHFGLNPSSIFTMVRCCCYSFLLFSLIFWEWVSLTFICAYPSLSSFLSRPLLLFHPASSPPSFTSSCSAHSLFSSLFPFIQSLALPPSLLLADDMPTYPSRDWSILSLTFSVYLAVCCPVHVQHKQCLSLSLSLFLTLWFSDFLTHSLYHQLSLYIYICMYVCIYIYRESCGVVIWAKFGHFRGSYLGQVFYF